jgi:hypothetical protein
VNQKLVLKAAVETVGVAEIVNGGAARVKPRLESLLDRRCEQLVLRRP